MDPWLGSSTWLATSDDMSSRAQTVSLEEDVVGHEWSEPPVRAAWSDERAQLSEELAILDRPLDDDIEYYDEPTGSRAKRVALGILALVVVGLGFGAYAAKARPSWLRGPEVPKEQAVAAAAPVPVAPEPPPAASRPLVAAAASPSIAADAPAPAKDKPSAGRRTSSGHQSGRAHHARHHTHRHRL